MLWLALAVLCSLTIAALLKVGERRGFDRVALLTVNYGAALALAAALQGGGGGGRWTAPFVALGGVQGVLFIGGFYVFGAAIRAAGVGTAAAVMRLSVVVPVLAAWAVWGEAPNAWQGGGLVLATVAFLLLTRPAPTPAPPGGPLGSGAGAPPPEGARPAPTSRAVLVLGLLFAAGGLVDVVTKTFAESFPDDAAPAFLLLVFGVAFALGLAFVVGTGLRSGRWPTPAEVGWGVVLGVVNYGSAAFLLRAAAELRAAVVFPTNAVAIMAGAVALGVVVWRERLSPANVGGLVLAAAALALLWM